MRLCKRRNRTGRFGNTLACVFCFSVAIVSTSLITWGRRLSMCILYSGIGHLVVRKRNADPD